jgi:sigma-B regulation protein RsbU (phosphoserine phosphatase)
MARPHGLVLGVAPDWTYTTGSSTLDAGDRLVCFTDGITEARSPDDEEFGEDRLVSPPFAAEPRGSAERLAQAIHAPSTPGPTDHRKTTRR